MDEAERQMGISEVRNTIGRITYIRNMEKELKEALHSRLPGIKDIKGSRYTSNS